MTRPETVEALEQVRREAKAEALREAASRMPEAPILKREELAMSRWLRDRADRIALGEVEL